ncbi:MAG: hypothetical protein ACRDU4_03435 [Mycobacterium sp.]
MTAGNSDNLFVRARSVLLDALTALAEHRDSVIVIGAQAVYLHTGAAPIAVAETTKDSDLAVDVRALRQDPLIDAAMERAGFFLDPIAGQPGAWMSPNGIPVDLMVPEAIAGGNSRRSVIHPPHGKRAMRRAVGLEAAVVDHHEMPITALSPRDQRHLTAKVAGPAALLIAKLHKIAERRTNPDRLLDKDAHDIYRLLVAISTDQLAETLIRLLDDELAGEITAQALTYLQELFADGAEALGSQMAARTEQGVGEPEIAAQASAALSADLLTAVAARRTE